jgi:hypothetical protein
LFQRVCDHRVLTFLVLFLVVNARGFYEPNAVDRSTIRAQAGST